MKPLANLLGLATVLYFENQGGCLLMLSIKRLTPDRKVNAG
jgi:hypothetical protein